MCTDLFPCADLSRDSNPRYRLDLAPVVGFEPTTSRLTVSLQYHFGLTGIDLVLPLRIELSQQLCRSRQVSRPSGSKLVRLEGIKPPFIGHRPTFLSLEERRIVWGEAWDSNPVN